MISRIVALLSLCVVVIVFGDAAPSESSPNTPPCQRRSWLWEFRQNSHPTNASLVLGATSKGTMNAEHDEITAQCTPLGTDCDLFTLDTADALEVLYNGTTNIDVDLVAEVHINSSAATLYSVEWGLGFGGCPANLRAGDGKAWVTQSSINGEVSTTIRTNLTVIPNECLGIMGETLAATTLRTRMGTRFEIREVCGGWGP